MSAESFAYRVEVEVTAPLYDTEVTDRVAGAIYNLFPNADVEKRTGELSGEARSLDHLSELLHRQEILDTAREQFHENRRGDTFSFSLKKQPAFEGRATFAVGEPDELGDLHVRVRVDEPSVDEVVDHVAPPTEDGRPIDVR